MKVTKFQVAFVVIGLLLLNLKSFAQDTTMKKEIPPNDFYAKALKDKATRASFESVIAWQKEGTVVLIDLRSTQEFNEKHVKGAINLPATELTDEALSKIIPTKNFKVVIYCANNLFPYRRVALTTLAYPTLKQLGYKNVQLLDDYPPENMLSAPSLTHPSSGTR